MIRPSTIWLVASREIVERIRGKATWIITVLTTVIAVGLIVIPSLTSQTSVTRVGLVGPGAQALAPALTAAARAAKADITTVDIASDSVAHSELTPSKGGNGPVAKLFGGGGASLDVALSIDGNAATIEAYQTVPPATAALITAVLDAVHQRSVLSAAGVPASAIAASDTPVPVTTDILQPAAKDAAGLKVAALASGMLLMYGVAGFGAAVATGVAQEKTSRTAEVLVAAVRPPELMAGKVLGIGLVGLGQMVVTVGAAMIANSQVKSTSLPPDLGTLLPTIIMWFILGFTLYAFCFAAAGALVARQEELQSVTIPVSSFLIVGLLLTYGTIGSPNSQPIRLLSFLPPLSPVLMPARTMLGQTNAVEVIVAVVLELASIVGIAAFSARIYQAALVRGGARVSWGEALRLGRAPAE